jgi:RNA polymerase sigma-70 factor (ECF subfamily)
MIPVNNTAKISSNVVDPELWVEAYRNSLFKYAISRLGDADLAEESIQETFLAALQSCKHFHGWASEKTWLISILKRKIYDHFRRISRDRQLHAAFPVESLKYDAFDSKRGHAVGSSLRAFDPVKAYEEKEFLKILRQALSELPRRLAQVFILREVVELSSREICEFMDIRSCNLYVMMHRARKVLRHNLKTKWFC